MGHLLKSSERALSFASFVIPPKNISKENGNLGSCKLKNQLLSNVSRVFLWTLVELLGLAPLM
jgi:hypothetical protein